MGMFKQFFQTVDMTKGTPWKKIAIFAVPMLIGNIAQQLYNTVDSIVVGKFVGDNALAAVGSAAPILNLLIVLFIGISMGASIIVAQYFGARNKEGLADTIGNCIILTAIASIIVTLLAVLGTRPMLELLNTPSSIIDWCASYLIIMFLGSAGLAYYNILSGVLRGLGDSISPLYYLLICTGLNIVLDLFFVAVLHMGVDGVALATVISQFISSILCMRKLLRMNEIVVFKRSNFKIKKHFTYDIIRLGLPSGITHAIVSMSMIIVQSLTNSFGEMFIAANVIVMRVDGFAMLPNFSFGTALTTYAGQNVGANYHDRVEKGARQGTLLAIGVSTTITALIMLFGKQLMGIFTDTQELVNLSMKLMRILAVGYIVMAITQSLSGIMRGAGDTVTPMWISLFTTVVVRVPLAYFLTYLTRSSEYPNGRQESIFISLLCSWLIGAFVTYLFYRRGKWKKRAIS
jgi:putative MATE family efflux protein